MVLNLGRYSDEPLKPSQLTVTVDPTRIQIENFNKALRSECFQEDSYSEADIPHLQEQADRFVDHYINRRWDMGLPDMMTPAQFKRHRQENLNNDRLVIRK